MTLPSKTLNFMYRAPKLSLFVLYASALYFPAFIFIFILNLESTNWLAYLSDLIRRAVGLVLYGIMIFLKIALRRLARAFLCQKFSKVFSLAYFHADTNNSLFRLLNCG